MIRLEIHLPWAEWCEVMGKRCGGAIPAAFPQLICFASGTEEAGKGNENEFIAPVFFPRHLPLSHLLLTLRAQDFNQYENVRFIASVMKKASCEEPYGDDKPDVTTPEELVQWLVSIPEKEEEEIEDATASVVIEDVLSRSMENPYPSAWGKITTVGDPQQLNLLNGILEEIAVYNGTAGGALGIMTEMLDEACLGDADPDELRPEMFLEIIKIGMK